MRKKVLSNDVACRKKGYIYCLYDSTNNICRIGQTTTKNQERQKSQMGYYPFELELHYFPVDNTNHAERYYHQYFKDKNKKSDWFSITPRDFYDLKSTYRQYYKDEYVKMVGSEPKMDVKPQAFKYIEKKNPNYKCAKRWFISANEKMVECEFFLYSPTTHKMYVIANGKKFNVCFKSLWNYTVAKDGKYSDVTIESLDKKKILYGQAIFI